MEREYINRGRDQFNIGQVGGNVHVHGTPTPTRSRGEECLLEVVELSVVPQLSGKLYQVASLDLAKESQPHLVRPNLGLKGVVKSPSLLSPDQTIDQVFNSDEISGKLLILGKPGAGKTIALLELAKVLIEQAKGDANEEIPVIFDLPRWRDEKQSIRDWVIEELNSKYGVDKKLAQVWLRERKLLPLLDGLDEVAPERQATCVDRINEFLQGEDSPLKLVVCSRFEEYSNLQTRLHLNGAVCLKELTDEQIKTYLTRLDRTWLWQVIAADERLLDLVRSPFVLSITAQTYQQSNSQLQQLQSASDPLQLLLDGYVGQRLHEQYEGSLYSKRKPPTPKETKQWLVWLARQMKNQSQTEFLIEEMQPSMLPDRQKWKYRLIWQLPVGLVFGLMIGLIGWILLGPIVGLMVGILLGLFCIMIPGEDNIRLTESLKWSWEFGMLTFLVFVLLVGLMFGLLGGLIGLIFGDLLWTMSFYLIGGLFVGLVIALLVGFRTKVDNKIKPNEGIQRSARSSLISTSIACLVFGLLGVLVTNLFSNSRLDGLVFGLTLGLIVGLFNGGGACLQHFSLRLLLYRNKFIPWDYARFLKYSTELGFLQLIGGRYRFIHKYLQDHFADMALEQAADRQ